LSQIEGIGEVVAQSIYGWFREKQNVKLLKKLASFDVGYEKVKIENKLAGLTFVITGSLESMSREEAEEKIRLLGGQASNSVSKETDYLVLGKNPGSKLAKAKKLGIKIIAEKELLNML
jgi:DNA ligase (NAD+)